MLTVQEATKRLGVSRAALYQAMATGKLKYTQKYGKRLFTEQALAAYKPRNYRNEPEEYLPGNEAGQAITNQ